MSNETCLPGHGDLPAETCPQHQATLPVPAPPEGQADLSAATCSQGQATLPVPTHPEDRTHLSVTTCPQDQATLPVPTRPEGPAAALARLSARIRAGEATISLNPVLRTVALVAWAALSGACGAQGADPVRTAQAFTSAVQRGDMKAVLPLLEKAATERLEQAAEQASDHVGGRRRVEPAEMLQIVDVSPTFELAQAELVDNDGATAHVRLVGAQQESHTLTLVFEDGAWHVRIPTPPELKTP